MKGQIALVNALIHLKVAVEYFTSFINDNPGTRGANLFRQYNHKINWILYDLITNPALPKEARDGIKKDVESDVLVIPALVEKIALLTPENRLALEDLVDAMLKGETITVEKLEEVK